VIFLETWTAKGTGFYFAGFRRFGDSCLHTLLV
jgi:hypothetical protein